MNKVYTLYSKDKPLFEFKKVDTLEKRYEIIREYDENKHLYPYLLKYDVEMLELWIDRRPIPTNREHIERVIESLALTSNPDPFEYLKINNGVSLNDSYWIKSCEEDLSWFDKEYSSVNLYENKFKDSLGIITFFGNISSLGGRMNTPELTTHGMLGKAWRQLEDGIYLYKKGSSGAANTGNEPYSEVIASNIAEILNINHVTYELDRWQDVLCTRCKLFTDIDNGYLTMYEFLKTEIGEGKVWRYGDIKKLIPEKMMSAIDDMIVFDFIIENKDRHFSNFGFMRDNNTGEIKSIAPIFDNGFSLLCFHMEYEFKNFDFDGYSETGTFNIKNIDQAKEIIKNNPRKYKEWANVLQSHIGSINLDFVPIYKADAIRSLLKSRCKMVQTL